MKFFFKLMLVISSFACNHSKDNNHSSGSASDPGKALNIIRTVRDIEPNLWKADSLQVLYYDNPDGDSLRYTRFFSYTETSDSTKISALLNELNQRTTGIDKKRDCKSEGKLFLLNKEEILKTIYFSTRGDSCSYMYFIKDGLFHYFSLSDKAKKFFRENKILARKP